MLQENILSIPQAVRYFSSGDVTESTKIIWFVFHGYGMSAKSFLEQFSELAIEDTVIISPEGPHRFYSKSGCGNVVASWMTKELRNEDMGAQIQFLNNIFENILNTVDLTKVKIGVLGFSQGSPAAFRWVSQLKTGVDMLISWGSDIARDVITDARKLRKVNESNVQLVFGSRDEFADDEKINNEIIELHDIGVAFDFHSFNGGHRLDDKTLRYFFSRLGGMNQEF